MMMFSWWQVLSVTLAMFVVSLVLLILLALDSAKARPLLPAKTLDG